MYMLHKQAHHTPNMHTILTIYIITQARTAGTADVPTNEMYGDCQELLQLFGIPYIIAPQVCVGSCVCGGGGSVAC